MLAWLLIRLGLCLSVDYRIVVDQRSIEIWFRCSRQCLTLLFVILFNLHNSASVRLLYMKKSRQKEVSFPKFAANTWQTLRHACLYAGVCRQSYAYLFGEAVEAPGKICS